MTPKSYFDNVWIRADLFGTLHAFISGSTAAALDPTELLRAEWAMRVSALDLYVHEVVAQNLVKIFQGTRPMCPGYSKLQITADALMRIHAAGPGSVSDAAFELEIREKLSRVTYQAPDDIADGIRLISSIELWNEVAKHHGATGGTVKTAAGAIKIGLSAIASRRNKIVHEGDLQPGLPRTEWPITRTDVDDVKTAILRVVVAIEALV
ncbi:hypothetical protein [Methylobacterium sp. WSM2598]|uniref:hypothetical protein n=1 Tax=Methylobacterium sp. WSM2598 TaxID=398261 RepID=UPI000370ED39|nr:hypothetical protein [Methylobacterium sp. WSM2598]